MSPEKKWAMTDEFLRARWDPLTCTGDEISVQCATTVFAPTFGLHRAPQTVLNGQ